MPALDKARELLSEIDSQIADAQKSLKELSAQRKTIAKLVSTLGGTGRSTSKRGRPKGKARGKRTDWNKVVASFKGSFSIDDLVKASKKAKGTVNQAIQNLKNAGKIKSTGNRGEYQRAGVASARPKSSKKKVAKKKVAKKLAAPKQPIPATAQSQGEVKKE
ncbi:MAG: hypothetical protein HY515_01435 [Candidatus Aenigmarchaeota archaeon]|nr:hypothetical protein [Candidatus Aenigmarchaeota archaeon]